MIFYNKKIMYVLECHILQRNRYAGTSHPVRHSCCCSEEKIEHRVADSLALRQFCRVYP
jgi:hypothetical protein